jgi:hypothetical protein
MINKILIDSSLDYEVTFLVKGTANTLFTFGIIGFDQNNIQVDLIDVVSLSNENLFFQREQLPIADQWYFIRGIIYNKDQIQLSADNGRMECGLGNNLRLSLTHKYIVPYIVLDNATGGVSGDLYVWDVKIRPLKFESSICGFVGLKSLIYTWMQNNSSQFSDEQVEDIMKRKLLPYNETLINEFL